MKFFDLEERTTPSLVTTLKDHNGDPLGSADLDTLTLTYYDVDIFPDLTPVEYGTVAFVAPSQIIRSQGSWVTDGYGMPGRVIQVSGAAQGGNNGTFTVVSATATILTIKQAALQDESSSATETVADTGIINERDAQDVLNLNGVQIDTGGTLTWALVTNETQIAKSSSLFEVRKALFEWTWTVQVGMEDVIKRDHQEITFRVFNRGKIE